MIELYVYKKPENSQLLNLSSFCAKSEAFMKFAQIDHTVIEFDGNPAKFSKGKLPIIKDNGEIIEDSSFIEEYLSQKFKLDFNNHLSKVDHAIGFSLSKLAKETLYWTLLSERWFVDENWLRLREQFFGTLPRVIKPFISNMVRRNTKKSSYGHGIGRHTRDEIDQIGRKCLQSISDFLGEKRFLFGDKISTYDISLYAVLSNALMSDLNPKLQGYAQKMANLNKYVESVSEQLVGDS